MHIFRLPCSVLFTYKFTLLSNISTTKARAEHVLFTYKFTLLSNTTTLILLKEQVLFTYKFTLLSNANADGDGISTFYLPINLHYSQTVLGANGKPIGFIYL